MAGRTRSIVGALTVAAGLAFGAAAQAQTTVSVGTQIDFKGWNPYAESSAIYAYWCQTYGCLGTFDSNVGDYQPLLAERWETDKNDPRIWHFYLRRGLKRHHDGRELTADDVVHSITRAKTDPQTAQTSFMRPIASAEAADKYTVKIVTTEPTAPLLDYLFDILIITGKDLYEKLGADADRKAPYGWGPYQIENIEIGQRMIVRKNPNWPGIKRENPDRVIFRRIREEEPRVTALLNGELQIAMTIPPHLVPRIERAQGFKTVSVPPAESMFLAMNVNSPPWDNVKLRQAVAYAIDREGIIKSVFQGQADLLDGPVGRGQYGYSADVRPRYRYDPKKAKALLAEAGYPNGLDVELFQSLNRYTKDRETGQAIAQMLTNAGIRTKLSTPDFSIYWPNVQKGKVPFYYHGRGGMNDPSQAIQQYFETGVTPRIGYSNPKLDALLRAERREFDPAKRKALLRQAFNLIQEEVPAFFVWRINSVWGISDKVSFTPRSDNTIFGTDIAVKQ